jgi:hypothetical protein
MGIIREVGSIYETYVSTKKEKTQANPWFSQENVQPGGKKSYCSEKKERQKKIKRVGREAAFRFMCGSRLAIR